MRIRLGIRKHTGPLVFGIGLPKTGTTTLNRALRILGYHCCPYIGYEEASLGVLERSRQGKPPTPPQVEFLKDQIRQYNAFEDSPWWSVYRLLDTWSPGCRFILTTRIDTDTWLRSLQAQEDKAEKTEAYANRKRITYGFEAIAGHEEEHRALYDRHLQQVETFFADQPGRLRTLCWETGHGWNELCAFLGCPVPNREWPHKNKSSKKP